MKKRIFCRKNIYIFIVIIVALVCISALVLLCTDSGDYHGVSVPDISEFSDVSESISETEISDTVSADISFDYSLPFYDYSDDESEISLPEDVSVSPEVSLSEYSTPEESSPEVSVPDVSLPQVSDAEVSEIEESVSEESKIEESEIEVSRSEESIPESSEPEESQPEESASEVSIPEESIPEVSEPEVSESEESVPEVSAPEVSEPETSGPETSVPDETSEPVTPPTIKPSVVFPEIYVPNVTSKVWNGDAANGFERGTGTKQDPYIIKTAEQLAFFRDSVNGGNSYEGKYIKLADNILLNDGDLNKQNLSGSFNVWVGIGTTKAPFYGTFDGGGYVISGIYGDGLFHTIRGSVRNVGVTNSYINFCGGIVGTASKDYKSSVKTVISNCYIVNSIVNGGGGVVDYAGGYDISDCYNGAYINASGDWVGGVIGQLAFGTATNCYNIGTIKGDTICGGVVGNSMRGTLKNCYNAGNVTSTFFAGALAGTQQSSTFTKCGYLSGTSEFVYQTYSGESVTYDKGIIKYTKDQIQY